MKEFTNRYIISYATELFSGVVGGATSYKISGALCASKGRL